MAADNTASRLGCIGSLSRQLPHGYPLCNIQGAPILHITPTAFLFTTTYEDSSHP